jgi:hypothetical protein
VFLPLPELDDTRWADLVEEGRALIPLYAPEWSDHNASDPGITFAELYAWLAEMQVFELDQIPARHRLKLLALAGISPAPPRPARTVLRFGLPPGAQPLVVPASLECEGGSVGGQRVRYRTLRKLRVVEARLAAVASVTAAGSLALTERWRRREPFAPFGDDPAPGAALVLSLTASLPVGAAAVLYVVADGAAVDAAERDRIERAEELWRQRCRTPPGLVVCDDGPDAGEHGGRRDRLLEHHSARTVWELEVGPDRWRRLDPRSGEIVDETRALTLSGAVLIVAPEQQYARPTADGDRFRLRCRFVRGAYDAAPVLADVSPNGVEAEQSVPAAATWQIAPKATVVGAPPPGDEIRLGLALDGDGLISGLDVDEAEAPAVHLFGYEAATADDPGSLTVEAGKLARSDGSPAQALELDGAPVDAASVRVWTVGPSGADPAARSWQLRPDLDASGPADAHAVLDAAAGMLTFGDGEHGLVPPTGVAIVAAYRTTMASEGDVRALAIDTIAGNPHNRGLLDPDELKLLEVVNPLAATIGADAETLEHAEGRAAELLERTTRAVTLADYERLALDTPGTRIARAAARANLHPGLPGVEAIGVVTVILLPSLPASRPSPSAGLLRAVSAQLNAHRLVGTRVEVTGPLYTEVAVRARVSALRSVGPAQLVQRIGASLDAFFDPLRGGPDGSGWPLGRDVIRSEVLQVVDGVTGVDHVLELDLVTADGVTCNNLCIGPLGLVAAGAHQLEVTAE